MPELPEVETMRRIAERELVGLAVRRVDVGLPKLLRDSPIPTLEPLLGETLLRARRRAKVLALDFTNGLTLLVHFKLAGQFAVIRPDGTRSVAGHPVPDPAGHYPHKTTHITFMFGDGTIAHYSDIRQFGWFRLMPTDDSDDAIARFGFGPEAVGENAVTVDELAVKLARRSIPVKTALLDQTVLAGLGNIYVDEALHRARIHPLTPAKSLSRDEVGRVHEASMWALTEGIRQGGAKILHHKAYPVDGFPAVHARKGEPCMHCGCPIAKIRVGQRGTYLCDTCQPLPAGVTPPAAAVAETDNEAGA